MHLVLHLCARGTTEGDMDVRVFSFVRALINIKSTQIVH